MSLIKTATAAVVLCASIAAPAFAQESYKSYGATPHRYAPETYYRSYDVPPGGYVPQNSDEYWSQDGFSGRNRSSVGGHSADVKPSGS